LGLILAGILLAGGPKNWQMGFGEGLVALAVVFWATETIIVKVYLKDINPLVLGWGRMFFGSMIMLGFLFFTGNVRTINSLSFSGFIWIIGTSVLLMGYVIGWFYALKNAPATVVTSILTLGFPLTVILNLIISGSFDPGKIIGSILIIGGGWLIIQLTSLRGQLELKHA
jgi:drug/metabolite transporter (DMT)-like permease